MKKKIEIYVRIFKMVRNVKRKGSEKNFWIDVVIQFGIQVKSKRQVKLYI